MGDSAGNIYALTGNGTFNGTTDFGDSFIKLWPNGPIQDWFVAPNRSMLEEFDLDPSSSGPVLTPDSNLLIGGGKDGIVYVLNPANLGHDGGPLQKFQATRFCDNPALIAATRSIRMLI